MKLIAEIGLNHLGNDKLAISIVKSCANLNLDGVTLQILPNEYYDGKKNYKKKLKMETYIKISKILKRKKKLFGLALMHEDTFRDFKNVQFDFIKVLSTAFNNISLISKIYRKTKTIVSTGVADLNDIKKMARKFPKVNFIHTSLSTETKAANLLAINTLQKNLKNHVSFGLHSNDKEVMLAAISLQPHSIFFYIKPNKNCYYPDDKHAIQLKELKKMIIKANIVKKSLGDGIKSKKKIPGWVFE